MSSHASTEMLSAYLDQELSDSEARLIEDHLADCEDCQTRFSGMGNVVASLKHLERMAPPSTLDQVVARRISLEGEQQSLIDRLEGSLGTFERQSSILGLFSLVVAFAMIILLFAQALDRRRHSTIPVIFQDPETLVRPMDEDPNLRKLAGRQFHLETEVWIEEGVSLPASRSVTQGSSEWQALVATDPSVAELQSLDRPAVIQVAGEVLRVDQPAAQDALP